MAELTSIGCHTRLWNFVKNEYHRWVEREKLTDIFPPILESDSVFIKDELLIGGGLHDSSSALIPYLISVNDPFMLISTGTWSICLNPFNDTPLKADELNQDCLSFLTFEGKQVKASRLFAGQMHEDATRAIAKHFDCQSDFFKHLKPDGNWIKKEDFDLNNLGVYSNEKAAYEAFMSSLVGKQINAIQLVLTPEIEQIFVDGGFSKNAYFLQGLKAAFPQINIFTAELAQASALGAALVIHDHWNSDELPTNLIALRPV